MDDNSDQKCVVCIQNIIIDTRRLYTHNNGSLQKNLQINKSDLKRDDTDRYGIPWKRWTSCFNQTRWRQTFNTITHNIIRKRVIIQSGYKLKFCKWCSSWKWIDDRRCTSEYYPALPNNYVYRSNDVAVRFIWIIADLNSERGGKEIRPLWYGWGWLPRDAASWDDIFSLIIRKSQNTCTLRILKWLTVTQEAGVKRTRSRNCSVVAPYGARHARRKCKNDLKQAG